MLASGFLPSLAFFLLAKVPPSFPRKESSFFREEGDLGVGDFGEDGDFCGEEAIVETRIGLDSIRDCLCDEPSEVHRKGRGNKTWSGSQVGGWGEKNRRPLPKAETEFQTFSPLRVNGPSSAEESRGRGREEQTDNRGLTAPLGPAGSGVPAPGSELD